MIWTVNQQREAPEGARWAAAQHVDSSAQGSTAAAAAAADAALTVITPRAWCQEANRELHVSRRLSFALAETYCCLFLLIKGSFALSRPI